MLQLQHPMTSQPEPLILEIPPLAIAQAETMLTQQSHAAAAWRAYRHHVALVTLCQWLQSHGQQDISPWLPPEQRAAFWEGTAGAALDWGEIRLVLLATETPGENTLTVPREWVDVPVFAGDYYLHVELDMDSDESWLIVTGYTTHQAIRNQGQLDPITRAYEIPREALVPDLTLLLFAQRLLGQRRAPIAVTPRFLPDVQAALLQTCIHQPEPRLCLPFEQWGPLFAQQKWRSQFYQARMTAAGLTIPSTALRQWFGHFEAKVKQAVEQSWQTLEAIATSLQSTQPTLAYRFGGNYRRNAATRFPDAVPGVLEVLNTSLDKETQLAAIYLLGQIGQGDGDAIAALASLQHTAPDIELRRHAAVSLGKIDPTHPHAGVRRGKILDLGLRLAETPILLVLTLLPDGEETNIQVRVCSARDDENLPVDLQLVITDPAGTVFREERSRQHTQRLQIAFTAAPNDQFGVQVSLNGQQVSELFTV
jgi:hypothetical protein